MSVAQVVQALQPQNLAAPVGRVNGALDERVDPAQGPSREPAGVRRSSSSPSATASSSGSAQVADVKDGTEEPRTLALYNGKEAVGIDIKKSKGYSTTDVARPDPRARRRRSQTTLPHGHEDRPREGRRRARRRTP